MEIIWHFPYRFPTPRLLQFSQNFHISDLPTVGTSVFFVYFCTVPLLSPWRDSVTSISTLLHTQWVKCHWAQGNAVPAPPVTEIQRSHTSNFIKRVPNHLFGAHFCPKLIYSSLTSDFPLQPLYLLTYILSLLTRRTLITAELQTFSRNHKLRR